MVSIGSLNSKITKGTTCCNFVGEDVIWLLAPESKYHVLEREDSVPAMFMDAKALMIIWLTISGVRGAGDADWEEEPR